MDTFFNAVLDALKQFFFWILAEFVNIGQSVIHWITSILPGLDGNQVTSAWGTIAFAIDAADQWAPIHEGISIAFTDASFILIYLTVKVSIKLIP